MLLQNQIVQNTYQIIRPIGKGGTSSVYLAYHLRLEKYVVIKQLRGVNTVSGLNRTEVDILKNLRHSHLPQVYDYMDDGNNVYTVIDFVDGHDLDAYVRTGTRLPEAYLKRYLRQIAQVLEYMHSQKTPVIHSDLKPGNIIIDREGNAVLIDFNTSIGANQGNLLGLTLPYASPEQIQLAQYAMYGQPLPFNLDERSDLYSLGATFYELICGLRADSGQPLPPLHTMAIPDYSREFLQLIDRLMERDREKRLQSAKKLVAAIDRLDNRYWTLLAMRCASLLLSGALMAGGVYCLIRGGRGMAAEEFRSAYQSAVTSVEQGYLDNAQNLCNGILASNDMQSYLQREPEELARLYHTIGDIYYYREEYGTASAYYRYALDNSAPESRNIYIRDAAIACAQYGDLAAAQELLNQAMSVQNSGEDIQLISIVIDARMGDYARCEEQARQLLAVCTNREICLRAAMAVASASPSVEGRIQWLLIARQYDGGRNVLRGLAMAYGQLAQTAQSEQACMNALVEAKKYYAEICDSVYASATDMINYSVILRMSGDFQGAVNILKTAEGTHPGHYRIMANLCFVYYEMGNESSAAVYCKNAIQAWRADSSNDKLSESSEEIQDLLEIGRRFGLGGN